MIFQNRHTVSPLPSLLFFIPLSLSSAHTARVHTHTHSAASEWHSLEIRPLSDLHRGRLHSRLSQWPFSVSSPSAQLLPALSVIFLLLYLTLYRLTAGWIHKENHVSPSLHVCLSVMFLFVSRCLTRKDLSNSKKSFSLAGGIYVFMLLHRGPPLSLVLLNTDRPQFLFILKEVFYVLLAM